MLSLKQSCAQGRVAAVIAGLFIGVHRIGLHVAWEVAAWEVVIVKHVVLVGRGPRFKVFVAVVELAEFAGPADELVGWEFGCRFRSGKKERKRRM